MLKITYSDSDIVIEQLATTVEAVVAQRSVLALRVGQPMAVQPGSGSFLLPTQLPGVPLFMERVRYLDRVRVEGCDRDWLEITLAGTWMAESPTSEQGILLVELGEALECQMVALWRLSLTWVASPQGVSRAC